MAVLQKIMPARKPELPETVERQCPRYRLLLGVQGKLADSTCTEVVIRNLSATGMLLGVQTPVTVGAEIAIPLPIVGTMVAEVVRVDGDLVGCVFRGKLSPASLKAVLATAPVVWLPDRGSIADRGTASRIARSLRAEGRRLTGSSALLWTLTLLLAVAMIKL